MKTDFRIAALGAAAFAAFAVAGCSSKDDVIVAENESVEEVAAKVAKADIRPAPGRWESKMTIDKIEMPGLPPEVQGMMKKQMGKVQTSISCLTKEEAEKVDGEFFKPGDQSGCKYNKFVMGGGKVEADMTCEQGPVTQNMKMSGTYGEDAYVMQVSANGKTQGQPMSMAMTVESRRVGECDGKEDS